MFKPDTTKNTISLAARNFLFPELTIDICWSPIRGLAISKLPSPSSIRECFDNLPLSLVLLWTSFAISSVLRADTGPCEVGGLVRAGHSGGVNHNSPIPVVLVSCGFHRRYTYFHAFDYVLTPCGNASQLFCRWECSPSAWAATKSCYVPPYLLPVPSPACIF